MKHIKLGPAITYYREQAGYTQQDLADKLGVSQPSIALYESNKNRVPLTRAYLLSQVLNVSLLDLIHKAIDLENEGLGHST
jgi:transcriptional regulator with XRE-family HTH domain